MTGSMRAVVLSGPRPVGNLAVVERPVPGPPGWVRVKVGASGLNRSELHTRLGLAEGVTFPRVPGIEAVGVVDSDCDLPVGTVCFTGMLSDEWIVRDFYPIGYLPEGVRLTACGGEASDLPADVLQRFLDQVAGGEVALGPTTVYRLEEIRRAHDLEHGRRVGKLVVVV